MFRSKEANSKERDKQFARFAFRNAIFESFYYELLHLKSRISPRLLVSRRELHQCIYSAGVSAKPAKLPLKHTLAFSGAKANCETTLEAFFDDAFDQNDRADIRRVQSQSLVLVAQSLSLLYEIHTTHGGLSLDQRHHVTEATSDYDMLLHILRDVFVEDGDKEQAAYLTELYEFYRAKLVFK
jgi:hypothetical protein